jgi:hypothetical protein
MTEKGAHFKRKDLKFCGNVEAEVLFLEENQFWLGLVTSQNDF